MQAVKYVWDRRKNLRNVRLHGIAFEGSVKIFEGPTLERIDDRFDYGETRFYAVGMTNGLEVTVIHTNTASLSTDSGNPARGCRAAVSDTLGRGLPRG